MADNNHFTLADILTEEEVNKAIGWWNETPTSRSIFHHRVLKELIEPNMARINASLGQENDPRYLAYVVEYIFAETARRS